MLNIPEYKHYSGESRIALLDNSAISFMEKMERCGVQTAELLGEYELILIPNWVGMEIKDSLYRSTYIENLFKDGLPIYTIAEENYAQLVHEEEGRLYSIVYAASATLGALKSYLRRHVEKPDPLDMDAYEEWIVKMYHDWPMNHVCTASGRAKRKNAGEISLTILAEIFSWYYPSAEMITIYTQDRDTYVYQENAHKQLKKTFHDRSPVQVGYKSNDWLLQQLYTHGQITLEKVNEMRTDERTVTYTKRRKDSSTVLVTQKVDNEQFLELLKDAAVQIIF